MSTTWTYQPLLPATAELQSTPVGTTGQIKVWNGSQWVTKPIKFYNGTTWVTTTY